MITKLTKEQQDKIPEFVDKWVKIGLSTEPADRKTAEAGIRELYKLIKIKCPKIIWVSSPLVGGLAAPISASIIAENKRAAARLAVDSAIYLAVDSAVRPVVDSGVRSVVDSAIYSAVRSAVDSAIYSAIYSGVRSAVDSAIYSGVRSAVYSAIYSGVRSGVRSVVYSVVGSVVDSVVDSAIYSAVRSVKGDILGWHPWLGGQFWIAYVAWAAYFRDVLHLSVPIDAYEKLAMSAGYAWMNINFCMICERPIKLLRNTRNRLHCENGMALKYPDGWGVYALNGVVMKSEYILTPADKLDIKTVMKETNAEVRMELIKKVGKERLLEVSEVVDTWGTYKLLDMRKPLMSNSYEPHLYMVNPSTGEIHCEGVGDECKTVEQAIHWTYPDDVRRTPIDEKGGRPFYQQGDVIIWEEGMITRQRYPIILT